MVALALLFTHLKTKNLSLLAEPIYLQILCSMRINLICLNIWPQQRPDHSDWCLISQINKCSDPVIFIFWWIFIYSKNAWCNWDGNKISDLNKHEQKHDSYLLVSKLHLKPKLEWFVCCEWLCECVYLEAVLCDGGMDTNAVTVENITGRFCFVLSVIWVYTFEPFYVKG